MRPRGPGGHPDPNSAKKEKKIFGPFSMLKYSAPSVPGFMITDGWSCQLGPVPEPPPPHPPFSGALATPRPPPGRKPDLSWSGTRGWEAVGGLTPHLMSTMMPMSCWSRGRHHRQKGPPGAPGATGQVRPRPNGLNSVRLKAREGGGGRLLLEGGGGPRGGGVGGAVGSPPPPQETLSCSRRRRNCLA